MSVGTLSSAFRATRLTGTTYLIKEYNDIFSEWPHIYIKIIPSADTIIVIDTGCGGRCNDDSVEVRSLREYIETYPVQENASQPLNPGGAMRYVVVTTHCHYDHILAVEQFKDSLIIASDYSPSFLSSANLAENSLCTSLGLQLPGYTPTLVPHLYELHSPTDPKQSLGLTILHTPGHTPDELALYDAEERMLYVGDILYEHERIIFPNEGSVIDWFEICGLLDLPRQ
ncbi:hypothetical protein AX16_002367 [Volvariella volvacea WC 439]|nr:hypothetical protein AX16_002367 [Volvariella volvacea WC 439]